MTKLIPAALFASLLACNSKPSWTEYKAGPLTMQFPCSPSTASAVTKCVRPDGSEYAVAVVDKEGISDAEELKQSKEYAENIPYGTLVKMDEFPLRWRESRRTVIIDSTLYYKQGKEYVISVSYTTEKPPTITEEFLGKVKME
jgi:hypothetical protein